MLCKTQKSMPALHLSVFGVLVVERLWRWNSDGDLLTASISGRKNTTPVFFLFGGGIWVSPEGRACLTAWLPAMFRLFYLD